MKKMHGNIRRIGDSQFVVLPKRIFTHLGINVETGALHSVEGDALALLLRRPSQTVRAGWADAAKRIAEADDDELTLREFGNASHEEVV